MKTRDSDMPKFLDLEMMQRIRRKNRWEPESGSGSLRLHNLQDLKPFTRGSVNPMPGTLILRYLRSKLRDHRTGGKSSSH